MLKFLLSLVAVAVEETVVAVEEVQEESCTLKNSKSSQEKIIKLQSEEVDMEEQEIALHLVHRMDMIQFLVIILLSVVVLEE
tara:strand:+ start:617 stop:862 length:246 start_codon:yes stop_codon:yes gene_type:complete